MRNVLTSLVSDEVVTNSQAPTFSPEFHFYRLALGVLVAATLGWVAYVDTTWARYFAGFFALLLRRSPGRVFVEKLLLRRIALSLPGKLPNSNGEGVAVPISSTCFWHSTERNIQGNPSGVYAGSSLEGRLVLYIAPLTRQGICHFLDSYSMNSSHSAKE